MRLDDAKLVHDQYRVTDKLETRISVWRPAADGRQPQDLAIAALAEKAPARVLEVGPGTGAFAERCTTEVGCDIVAVDSSPAMVAATAARGISATLADVQHLPFDDGAFDAAVAAWMLYHVPDRGAAISELARVLRPGGRLVAITNSRTQLAELWKAVEYEPTESGFSSENGRAQLEAHFSHVERHDIVPMAVFEDRATAAAYIESLGSERAALVSRLPDDGWPLVAHGATSVFVADK
jgi:SAM-dependent methyltransferase